MSEMTTLAAVDQQFADALYRHYQSQIGGGGVSSYPLYRGQAYQFGNGIGDIFKSIVRFLAPIFAPAATTFLSSAATGIAEGKSFKESAKSALKPTVGVAMTRGADQLTKGAQEIAAGAQAGSGRRGRKRKSRANQAGGSSRKRKVYKGARKNRRKSKRTSQRFLPSNF